MPRLVLLLVSLVAAAAVAQEPAPPPPATEQPPAASPALPPADVLVMIRGLDALLVNLQNAAASTKAAQRLPADDDVRKQLADTEKTLAERIASLQARRDRAFESLPMEWMDPVKIVLAGVEASHRDKEPTKAMRKVATDARKLAESKPKPRGADQAVLLADYFVADALRAEAARCQQDGHSAQAIVKITEACQAFERVANAPDAADFPCSTVGSSVRASALCWKVKLHTSLYRAYDDLAKQAEAEMNAATSANAKNAAEKAMESAKAHAREQRKLAEDAFKELTRRFNTDTDPNGKRFVDVAREGG
jgi:hypothetical protein